MYENRSKGSSKILIVEDEIGLAELYAYWLEDDYDIDMAHDCNSAYWRFLDPIDVMVVDRNLPDGSGDELVANIRELGLDCRIIMVTAAEPTIDVLDIDFDDYLCKPISQEELHSTITRLLDQRSIRDGFVEFNRIKTKIEVAEAYCSPSKLETSEQYASLKCRLDELRVELDETTRSYPEMYPNVGVESASGD